MQPPAGTWPTQEKLLRLSGLHNLRPRSPLSDTCPVVHYLLHICLVLL